MSRKSHIKAMKAHIEELKNKKVVKKVEKKVEDKPKKKIKKEKKEEL